MANLFDLDLTKLQSQTFDIHDLGQTTINDVYLKQLTRHVDSRGDLTELWSQPWSVSEPIESTVQHIYANTTHQGVTKAWHIHQHTTSQYTCISGKLQVILVDIRNQSSTQFQVNQFLFGTFNPCYLKIPPGVLKGWKSIQGDSVIVNLLSSADQTDNQRIPWDAILSDLWLPKMG